MISKKIISGLAEMTQNTLGIFTFQVCLGTLTIHSRNTTTIVIQFKVFRHAMLLSSHLYSLVAFYHLIPYSTRKHLSPIYPTLLTYVYQHGYTSPYQWIYPVFYIKRLELC